MSNIELDMCLKDFNYFYNNFDRIPGSYFGGRRSSIAYEDQRRIGWVCEDKMRYAKVEDKRDSLRDLILP